MPFPFVAVTLPPDTPPAYVTALLEACTQAYGEGECKAATDSAGPATSATSPQPPLGVKPNDSGRVSPPTAPADQPPASSNSSVATDGRISATVGWQDALRAEIFLGLPDWLTSRWIEWHLDFKEQDQLVERHRAVGFALGRLAVTVAEVARREREFQGAVATAEPPPSAVAPRAEPPPVEQPSTQPAPATVSTQPIPLQVVDDHSPYAPTSESSLLFAARLGAELGTGFRGLRIGGAVGGELVFDQRYVLGLRGYLTRDAFEATFAGVELLGGLHFEPEPIELQLTLGAGWNYVSARQDKAAFEHVVGGVACVGLALSKTAVSPFLNVAMSVLQEGVDTNVPSLSAYGPVVPRVQVGLKLRPELF